MKCPMLMYNYLPDESPTKGSHSECIQKECAWWEQDINLCAVKEIALELRYTQQRLADMAEKMPREGQFRR